MKISYGVHSLEAAIAGKSVGEVRQALKEPLNIDPRALALVNGRDVAASLRPQRGRPTGVRPPGRGERGQPGMVLVPVAPKVCAALDWCYINMAVLPPRLYRFTAIAEK